MLTYDQVMRLVFYIDNGCIVLQRVDGVAGPPRLLQLRGNEIVATERIPDRKIQSSWVVNPVALDAKNITVERRFGIDWADGPVLYNMKETTLKNIREVHPVYTRIVDSIVLRYGATNPNDKSFTPEELAPGPAPQEDRAEEHAPEPGSASKSDVRAVLFAIHDMPQSTTDDSAESSANARYATRCHNIVELILELQPRGIGYEAIDKYIDLYIEKTDELVVV